MRTIIVLVIILIVGLSLLNVYQSKNNIKESLYNEVEQLIKSGKYDPSAQPLLERSLEILSKFYIELNKVRVNQVAKGDELSIVVLDLDDWDGSLIANSLITKIKNNFITVGYKYILADKRFINYVLHNSNVDFSAELQIEERLRAVDRSFDETSIHRTFISSMMLRGNNAYYALKDEGDMLSDSLFDEYNLIKNVSDTSEYEEVLKSAGVKFGSITYPIVPLMVHYISEDNPKNKFPFGDAIAVPFSAVLAPYLLHEMGHIKNGYYGAFIGDILEDFDSAALAASLDSENKADEYAIQRLINAQEKSEYTYNIGNYNYSMYRGIYSAAKSLEDMAFYGRFWRFRDMNTQTIGNFLEYHDFSENDCKQTKRGFFDINYIEKISETLIPILSEEEYLKISTSMATTSSHPHFYARSKKFQKYGLARLPNIYDRVKADNNSTYASIVRSLLTGAGPLSRQSLTDAYKNDLARIYPGKMRSGISISDSLIKKLETIGVSSKPVAVCPFEQCLLLTDDDGLYLEIGMNSNLLVYLTMYIRAFSAFNIEWDQPWKEPTDESIERLKRHLEVFKNIVGLTLGKDMESQNSAIGLFYQKFNKCGFSSYQYQGQNGRVRISTTDNDYSLFLNFVSN